MNTNNIFKSIAGVYLAMLFISCTSENLDKIKLFEEQEQLPNIVVEDLHTIYTSSGRRKGNMEAELVHIYKNEENPYYEFPNGMKVEMFDNNGKFESVVSSNYAKYFENERMWEARYNVRAINSKGDTLETEQVYIYEKEQRIFSDVQVQITSKDGMRIVGKNGFNSNLDFTNYKFNDVIGVLNVKVDRNQKKDSVQTVQPK